MPKHDPDKDLWIVVVGWDKFQHPDTLRTNQPPRWIKNWVDLLRRDEYRQLTGNDRAALHGLWLEYASTRARLRLDTRSLTQRIGLRVTKGTLERLYHAGFLTFSASEPQADSKQTASLEVEVEVEKKKVVKTPNSASAREPTWHCPLDGHDQYYTWTGPHAASRLESHLTNLHELEGDQLADAIKKGTPA